MRIGETPGWEPPRHPAPRKGNPHHAPSYAGRRGVWARRGTAVRQEGTAEP